MALPPCIRHRPFLIAQVRQGRPLRVFAPHCFLLVMGFSVVLGVIAGNSITCGAEFAIPPGNTLPSAPGRQGPGQPRVSPRQADTARSIRFRGRSVIMPLSPLNRSPFCLRLDDTPHGGRYRPPASIAVPACPLWGGAPPPGRVRPLAHPPAGTVRPRVRLAAAQGNGAAPVAGKRLLIAACVPPVGRT